MRMVSCKCLGTARNGPLLPPPPRWPTKKSSKTAGFRWVRMAGSCLTCKKKMFGSWTQLWERSWLYLELVLLTEASFLWGSFSVFMKKTHWKSSAKAVHSRWWRQSWREHIFFFKAEILAGNEGGVVSMSLCGQACPLNVHYYLATEKTRKPQEDWVVFWGQQIQSVRVWYFSLIYTWRTIIDTCHIHM